ncbi:MAG: response regulator [Elusimicrobia bacterium]|nr:response regulator [Elusimicrobiota bacterium]
MPNREREFTSFEAAKACGVFQTTLVGWVNRGRLKARFTPGGHRRILLSHLVEFMRKHDIPIPTDLAQRPKRILVVEDDPANQRLLVRILKALPNVEVQACSSGLEAMILIGKEAPDLLILDIYIPGINGLAVCKLLRSTPHTQPIKIIAVSGEMLSRKNEAFLREHADHFFRKPFDIAEIKAKSAALLSIDLSISAANSGR